MNEIAYNLDASTNNIQFATTNIITAICFALANLVHKVDGPLWLGAIFVVTGISVFFGGLVWWLWDWRNLRKRREVDA